MDKSQTPTSYAWPAVRGTVVQRRIVRRASRNGLRERSSHPESLTSRFATLAWLQVVGLRNGWHGAAIMAGAAHGMRLAQVGASPY